MFLIFVVLSTVVVNICGDNSFFDYRDDELDNIFDDILNGYDTNIDSDERYDVRNEVREQPQLSNGIWKCGHCTDIDESKLIYTDTLDLDTNYDDNFGMELQIGFSVKDMRCITILALENFVRRVSGACAGEEVTLSLTKRGHVEVNIYN
ncbi:uncharacterized protein LOC124531932 isoform X2 [Vanessa cardui]|uniref:uncharacterized protein LOC124531932 isoform X2 n=1 Tax=Vanessa cardui TaxID=171605 RepID=UPI001F12BBA5|nr:uncharacterized protein LOC124531932 isoform X2 [Vanessa cardui]